MSDVLLPRLIAELPALGGWPEWAHECVLHNGAQKVMFYDEDGRFSHQPKFPQIEFDKESNVGISVSREAYESALAASKTEWDGDGLPPVGCECEWQDKNTKAWIPVVIAYSSERVTVVRELRPSKDGDAVECCINNYGEEERLQFRPIRSEADKKRDEIIEALKEGLGHAHGLYDLMQVYRLLNNGKIPHIRID